jgi:murein DD-endopeptidase MepM/ murein hydrolase activator NlpD
MLKRFISIIALSVIFSLFSHPVSAQTASGPVYIVQPGDTLSLIASRFNVDLTDLMNANGITDPNLLAAGQELVIPGLEGISGVLVTEYVQFGDTFRSLSRRTQIGEPTLRKLNHLVSPSELYVGTSLIVPQQNDESQTKSRITPSPGESLLELAVKSNTDPWTLAAINDFSGTWDALPGDSLYSLTGTSDQSTSGLPSAFLNAEVKTLPLKQGGTAEIIVRPADGVTLGGTLVDQPLHFFDMDDGNHVAIQGVNVELKPGAYPLRLDATLPDGSSQSFEQMILVKFGLQNPVLQSVPPMDPNTLTVEDQQVASIVSNITPTKYWQNEFLLPVAQPFCITEWFGTPRSYTYNGNDFGYFHSGVDYGVCSQEHPLDIYAAAAGKVVFVGALPIRGNATIVDDGWGVYSVYGHQKEIYVTVGQQIEAGQTIGQIGATGHVTGPHLHFEMWVNGMQVNPLDWLQQAYP